MHIPGQNDRSHQYSIARRGSMLVTLGILMVAFMAVAAISIEIAQVHLARTELRTATEAAARAAAENLSRTSDPIQASQRGVEIAGQNQVMGQPLVLMPEHFEFGCAVEEQETGRLVFVPDRSPANSVRVSGTRTPDGAIPLLLAKVIRRDLFDVRASATASCVEQDVVLTLSTATAE